MTKRLLKTGKGFTQVRTSESKGFTLIELLVVIAIIGLLASIILASLNTAQQKGRDARRISDLKEAQLALELYYDAENSYPVGATALSTDPASSSLPASLAPTYITQLATDPSQPSSGASPQYYQYVALDSSGNVCTTAGSCQGYVLVAALEAGSNSATWAGTVGSFTCPAASAETSAPYWYCVHS